MSRTVEEVIEFGKLQDKVWQLENELHRQVYCAVVAGILSATDKLYAIDDLADEAFRHAEAAVKRYEKAEADANNEAYRHGEMA